MNGEVRFYNWWNWFIWSHDSDRHDVHLLLFCNHLIVTWNPHHRPAIPLTASLILSIGPMFALSMEGDGTSSIGEMLEIAFLITSLGAGIIVLWMPVILALVSMQMLRVSRMRPSDDPLIEMLEN